MSKIEVDTIEPQSGTTVTLGASGDTVALASGVTLSGFTSTGIDDNATSTAITISSGQNVGIGTTSPTQKLDIGSGTLRIKNAIGDSSGLMLFQDTGDVSVMNNYYAGAIAFQVNSTERMRIDSSGNLKIAMQNFANAPSASNYGISFNYTGVGSYFYAGGTTTNNHIVFGNPNGQVGSIQTNGSATLYNTSSDYRLKENVNYNFDATTRLKQLRPARFNFIADADTTVDGFLAHEVQSVVPEAISGTHNETETKEKVVVNVNGKVIAENIEQADWEAGKIPDENGNTLYPTDSTWEATKVVPVYQAIDQSKLVPLLVKTIQELEARITALENN